MPLLLSFNEREAALLASGFDQFAISMQLWRDSLAGSVPRSMFLASVTPNMEEVLREHLRSSADRPPSIVLWQILFELYRIMQMVNDIAVAGFALRAVKPRAMALRGDRVVMLDFEGVTSGPQTREHHDNILLWAIAIATAQMSEHETWIFVANSLRRVLWHDWWTGLTDDQVRSAEDVLKGFHQAFDRLFLLFRRCDPGLRR